MPSNKYQKKKAVTQSQVYTPTDKSKKSLNITRTPATPPSTLTITTPIITETTSDSNNPNPNPNPNGTTLKRNLQSNNNKLIS